MALHDDRYLGISEVAESTGFSVDTLRWYEREGLFPRVERDSSRRRRYSPHDLFRSGDAPESVTSAFKDR